MFKNILLAVAFACAAGMASATELQIDLNQCPIGQSPTGFVSMVVGQGKPGEWKVIEEDVPPLLAPLSDKAQKVATKHRVLAQLAQDPTDEHFALLLFTNEVFGDFTLTTRVKIVSGNTEQMAGVVFRTLNGNNFYVARASVLGNNFRWYKVTDGHRGDPIGSEVHLSTGEWHEIKVVCQGIQIRCFLDQKLVVPPPAPGAPTDNLAVNDPSFSLGKIGFVTKSDSVAYFADTKVEYTPRIPFVQTIVSEIIKKYPRLLGLKIYAMKNATLPVLIAERDEQNLGSPGTPVETDVIQHGSIYFDKSKHAVEVTLPLRDRNGDIVAALKTTMKGFLGETQDTAISRAIIVKKDIEEQIQTLADLSQ